MSVQGHHGNLAADYGEEVKRTVNVCKQLKRYFRKCLKFLLTISLSENNRFRMHNFQSGESFSLVNMNKGRIIVWVK